MGYLAHPVRASFVPALAVAAAGAWYAAERLGTGWPVGWFAGINLATYPVWWIDKRQSRRQRNRVPESTLHLLSLVGGGIAAVLAMRTLRHKTMKPAFRYGHPLLAALGLAAFGYWLARA